MQLAGQPRRARVYDRLEGQEPQEPPRRRFAEVDAAAEALRPGSVVALAFECDELLAVQRTQAGGWALTTLTVDWSSRGASGWHTHAGDYAVESLEPHCMFRVLRDGRHLALASVAADGLLLCATGGGDSLALAASNPGAWVNAGAAWEHRDGAIYSSRWQEKALAVRMLHVTCLPTLQLQRVEEFYGALLHEQHAEKAAALRRAKELEAERDAAVADARTWRRQHEDLEQQLSLLRERTPAPASAERSPTLLQGSSLAAPPSADVTSQLAALQQQLESLAAEGELPALAQERARMSICLRTIKEITDLVRQSASPSTAGSPSQEQGSGDEQGAGPREVGLHGHGSPPAPGPFATDTEGESRLVDYHGPHPDRADPLARVLDQPLPEGRARESPPPRRVLRSLAENSMGGLLEAERSERSERSVDDASACDPASAPPSSLKRSGSGALQQPRLPPLPLADKLSAAVRALEVGSPHTADGVAQYLATSTNLRASQQRLGGASRLRSSFLQRPPAAVEDLYYR